MAQPITAASRATGHAFALLAASSAKLVDHPLADRMLADVTEVINTRFWQDDNGVISEEFNADWSPISPYQGQNSNMHMTEALMAAFEATGDRDYLDKAERIADLIIRRRAAENGWRVAEHFDADWAVDRELQGRRSDVPPAGHDARPLARMGPPDAPALGARRPQEGLDAGCGCGPF